MNNVVRLSSNALEKHISSVIHAVDNARGIESPALTAAEFIKGANLEQLRMLALEMSNRLFVLAAQHSGMAEANLEEAANLAADVAIGINGAMNIKEEACECGKCDDCVAALSDLLHDRKVDAALG